MTFRFFRSIFPPAVLLLFSLSVFAEDNCDEVAGELCLNQGMTWVMLGDSITYQQLYSNYIEAYFHLRYPGLQLHIRSAARSGSTLTEVMTGEDRYRRHVHPHRPDLVSVLMGHNSSGEVADYEADIRSLTEDYIEALDQADLLLISPQPSYPEGKEYLADYADVLEAIGVEKDIPTADLWHRLQPIWQTNANDSDPVDLQFEEDDTVHPGAPGHLMMAYAVLESMGVSGEVSSAVIDGQAGLLIEAVDATVSNIEITSLGLEFDRLDERLPMPLELIARDGLLLMPEVLDLNRYMLTVQGLQPGEYEIYVDGILSAEVTAQQLADGWNMALMSEGPIFDQLRVVLSRIRDKEGVDADTRERVGPPWQGVHNFKSVANYLSNVEELTGAEFEAQLADTLSEIAVLDAAIHTAAVPQNRHFLIRKIDTAESYCGNGVIEAGEVCDAGQFGGASCSSEGFDGGALACSTSCATFDVSACFVINPPVVVADFSFDTTLDDTVTGLSGQAYGTSFVAGQSGEALHLEQDTYASLGSRQDLLQGKQGFSVTGWFRQSDLDFSGHELIIKQPGLFYLRRHNNSDDLYFVVFTSDGIASAIVRDVFADTNWQHFAAVWDGEQMQVYINGEAGDPTPPSLGGVTEYTDSELTIGSPNGGESFRGDVDMLKVWDKALTTTEVMAEMEGVQVAQCSDSDGNDIFTQGSVFDQGETLTDFCSGQTLTEYLCQQGQVSTTQQVCTAGCNSGACQFIPDSCGDSDGGNDPFQSGAVSGHLNLLPYSTADYCISDSNVSEQVCVGADASAETVSCGVDTVTESYCSGSLVYQDNVDFGCAAGACNVVNTPVLLENCDDNDGWSAAYCEGADIYRDFSDFSCTDGGCSESIEPQIQSTCEHGCDDGTCLPEPPPPSDMALHYAFNGDFVDGVSATAGTAVNATIGDGVVGQGGDFTAIKSYVDIGTNELLVGLSSFTVSTWIKQSDLNHIGHEVFVKQKNVLYMRRHNRTDDLYVVLLTDEGLASAIARDVFTDTEWHHVAAVWDGSSLQVYVDGTARDATPPAIGGLPQTSNYNLTVGSSSSSEAFNGHIDEFKVFPFALSEDEILAESTD